MSHTSVTSAIVSGVTVNDGDALFVDQAGIALATGVTSGGIEIVDGGTSIGTVLHSSGGEHVVATGIAIGTTVETSGHLFVTSGGRAFDTAITGGRLTVSANGLVEGTSVGASGFEVISSGGEAISTTVLDGGKDVVLAGGVALSATVASGGAQIVGSSGTAETTTVAAGGAVYVASGGTAVGTTVDGPGSSSESAGLIVRAGGTASNTTLNGGELELRNGGTATGFIDFAGSGVLKIDPGAMQNAVISGFGAGDVIDLAELHRPGNAHLTFDSATNQLTVTEGTTSVTLQFDPTQNLAGASFSAITDGGGGSDITVTCFAAGTAIATPAGPVAVEALRAGDTVLLADGTAARVRWRGVQTVATRFADPVHAWPIRISAGALGDNLPVRDLVVSPGHGLLVDGLLVQAGALVNGDSIRRATGVPEQFRYYHVELEAHALLLAEGVPAESYREGVEPMSFDNADERPAGDVAAAELPYPRVKARRQVPAALVARLARPALVTAA